MLPEDLDQILWESLVRAFFWGVIIGTVIGTHG